MLSRAGRGGVRKTLVEQRCQRTQSLSPLPRINEPGDFCARLSLRDATRRERNGDEASGGKSTANDIMNKRVLRLGGAGSVATYWVLGFSLCDAMPRSAAPRPPLLAHESIALGEHCYITTHGIKKKNYFYNCEDFEKRKKNQYRYSDIFFLS